MTKHYFFTSESVSEGHPDKVADAISDSILDSFIAKDANSHVACETLVTTGQVVLAGEVTTESYVDVQKVVRNTINKIGYTKSEYMFDGNSCGILSSIHSQSPDIAMGVNKENEEEQGAGDQGMMFGYATNETDNFMPMTLDIAHEILKVLSDVRKGGVNMKYLRPDAKSQVTIEYDEFGKPLRIDTIVVSTQHDEFGSDEVMRKTITDDIKKYVLNVVLPNYNVDSSDFNLLVNPTGRFVIGGPHGDSGLTGRKIIVDTYGGWGAHGGGAFSGKDPSKVDRSAAYAARHIAKNIVAAGVCDKCLVQVSYAIGVAQPVSLYINTYGTSKVDYSDGEISSIISEIFDMRPKSIETRLKLRNPIYSETSSYGHFGRTPKYVLKNIDDKIYEVELFTWEKLDYVGTIKTRFNL